MAYIRKHRNKWRAEVDRHGQRVSKVADTEEEANTWAAFTEARLDAQTKRYRTRDQLAVAGPDLVTMVPRCVLDAAREIPHPQIDILEAAIPTSKASGVYFLICGGEVAYVGQSVDVLGRISRHRREGKLFDAFSYIECEADQMDRLETLYIKAFVPAGNLSFGNHREQKQPPDARRRAPRAAPSGDSAALMWAPRQGIPAA